MDDDLIFEELTSIQAIFPEAQVNTEKKLCVLNIPIALSHPIPLLLQDQGKNTLKKTTIDYLPTLKCSISLPDDYPLNNFPKISISGGGEWLSNEKLQDILRELFQMWENCHDLVIYSYLDYLNSNSSTAFNMFEKDSRLITNSPAKYYYFIEQHQLAKDREFNSKTFNCEICQDKKKGLDSTQFPICNHVFCNHCLENYFSLAISRGEIENVHCPSFECTKLHNQNNGKLQSEAEYSQIKDFAIFDKLFFRLPVEKSLLQKFIHEESLIERYDILHYRMRFDKYRQLFPNRVAECPREHCETFFVRKDINNKLTICPTCKFAFCIDCLHSWHGNNNNCASFTHGIPEEIIKMWIENDSNPSIRNNLSFKYGRKLMDLAAENYIADKLFEKLIISGDAGIVKCPSCELVIQRSDGCNKMTCSRCLAFFCNLCATQLSKSDPYAHFNDPTSSCFHKLFEGLVEDDIV